MLSTPHVIKAILRHNHGHTLHTELGKIGKPDLVYPVLVGRSDGAQQDIISEVAFYAILPGQT